MSVGYARDETEDESKEDEDKNKPCIPVFKTLQQWEPVKSTKMDTCAKICRHMLTRDDVPAVIFKEGQAIFPQIPTPIPGRVKKETKILIYQEFTSLGPLLRNVTFHYLSFQFDQQ
jgi:hypothetical protein